MITKSYLLNDIDTKKYYIDKKVITKTVTVFDDENLKRNFET